MKEFFRNDWKNKLEIEKSEEDDQMPQNRSWIRLMTYTYGSTPKLILVIMKIHDATFEDEENLITRNW